MKNTHIQCIFRFDRFIFEWKWIWNENCNSFHGKNRKNFYIAFSFTLTKEGCKTTGHGTANESWLKFGNWKLKIEKWTFVLFKIAIK